MRPTESAAFELVQQATLGLLCLGMVLAFIRLVRGPSAPDRIVALDLISNLTIGIISVYSTRTSEPLLLRVAAALALSSFLSTLAVARYLEKSVSQ